MIGIDQLGLRIESLWGENWVRFWMVCFWKIWVKWLV